MAGASNCDFGYCDGSTLLDPGFAQEVRPELRFDRCGSGCVGWCSSGLRVDVTGEASGGCFGLGCSRFLGLVLRRQWDLKMMRRLMR